MILTAIAKTFITIFLIQNATTNYLPKFVID